MTVPALAPAFARIREKLDRLRRLDDGSIDVGGHEYREGRRLTEQEIAAVEQDFEISFPEEFRAFLLEVHSGGAGPHYGLLPITEEAPIVAAPSVESPLTEEDAQRGSIEKDAATDEDGDPVGIWPLADVGCGITEVLVVTGRQRGFVWSYEGGVWTAALDTKRKQLTFNGWYEAWLDDSLAKLGASTVELPAKSCYVLELASDTSSEFHATCEPAELRRALERFCDETRVVSYTPPAPNTCLGIWVLDKGETKAFIDARPSLALVCGEQRVVLDAPEKVARLLDEHQLQGRMAPIGKFRVEALWDLLEQQLPILEEPRLEPGGVAPVYSALPPGSSLPRRLSYGPNPPPPEPAVYPPLHRGESEPRPSLTSRFLSWFGK